MSSRFLTVFALVLTTVSAATTAFADAPDPDTLAARVRTLAGAEFAGRGNGTPELRCAADTVAAWFASAGLEPAGTGTWFQDFELGGEDHRGQPARNVVGVLPGRGALASRAVVVGAHYDHLGLRLDAAGRPDGFYPGAEDNASGVAALGEVARLAAAAPGSDRRTVYFVAFAGEEIGLQGSRWFVDHAPMPLASVDLMLNLDSVGRLRDDRLYVGGVGSAAELRGIVTRVDGQGFGFDLQLSEGGWDASDHVSFNAAGVPVLFLFTGPHPQYHSVDDTADLVEGAPLARVAAFASGLLEAVASRPDPLEYRAVSELSSATSQPGAGKKRAWLGTIPDFVDDVVGVKLAGVMPGSPAAEAGLEKGDVVVAFGELEITGLPDLTVALQTHREGEMVTVVYLRGGERRSLPVTLRPRPR